MKKIILLFALAWCSTMLYGQSLSVDLPALLWTNGSQSGACWNNNSSVCHTSICLGESVCLAYSLQGINDYADYASNHETLVFSDGGSVVIENTYYTGPNPTGCVNYTPVMPGAVVTNTNTGIISTPFIIDVFPAAPPVMSANISPSNPVCTGSQVCAESFNSPVISYGFSSGTSVPCNNPVPCPNGATAFCFPTGNHQILYTVNAGHTCSNTAVYNVNVIAAQLQVSVAEPAQCGDQYCFTASTTAGCIIANAVYYWTITDQSGSYTYNISGTSPTICMNLAPGLYDVHVYINEGTLVANTSVNVQAIDPCVCFACNAIATTGTLSASPALNQKYCMTNNVTITGTVTLKDCEIKLKPNTGIVIAPGAVLTIDHAKLFGDAAMWTGITIQDGGRLIIRNNALIEDALIGVQVFNHTNVSSPILSVDNSIFNKNHMDIRIHGYAPNMAVYPFSIVNSLFTCRVLTNCDGFLTWPATATVKAANNPTTSPLETPYIHNTLYPVTTLKAPYTGSKSFFGIRVENVGYSSVSATPVYRQLEIGTATGTNLYNVFDNHYIGVDVINSNISVVNSVFQNGWNLSFPTLYACGVKAITRPQLNNRLLVSSASYANNNKFFDVSRGIRAENYFDVDVSYCDMASTRVFNINNPTQNGAYGISMQSNHYTKVISSFNRIFNIDNGIDFKATVGTFSVGSMSTTNNGQYVGTISCNGNLIRTNISTPNPALHYGFKGITLTGLIGGFRYTVPGAIVQTNDNRINGYVNGISCTNWIHIGVATKDNKVVITQYVANTYQYGIEHANNTVSAGTYFKEFGICDNTVSSISQYSKTQKTYGIRSAQNTNQAVLCNTVTTMFNGVAFSGYHPNDAYVRFNVTDNDHYGFVLENQGRIGTQGSPAVNGDFLDQKWIGTYPAPDFKTAVINSNAQFSKINVRSGTTSDPNGSGYTNGVTTTNYSNVAGTIISHTGYGNVSNCILTKPGFDQPTIPALEVLLGNAADSLTNPRALYVAKTQLYNYLRLNNVSLTSSTPLDSFYTENAGLYREIFYDAEADMAEGNTATAEAAISAYTPANNIQTKHKLFFVLLLNYQNETLTGTDKENLLALAKGCSSLDGTVIHQARALYNLAFDKARVFEDSCDYNLTSLRKAMYTDQGIMDADRVEEAVRLYPNPSQGEVYISVSDKSVQSLELSISSVNGGFISKEILTFTYGVAKLHTAIANGVYMVTLLNTQTKQRVIKKLVIQK